MTQNYLGIDLGGTKIKSVVINEAGRILDRDTLVTEDHSDIPYKWRMNAIGLIDMKANNFGINGMIKCGISAPGLVDQENRKILIMPDRLQGLEDYNWSEELDRDIFIINDGHSACLAEYESFYKAEGIQNMITLTLGTGVGGGTIINGKIFQGEIQRAGHFGHITVNHKGNSTMTKMVGSLEHAFGNFSVEERTHNHYKTVKDLTADYAKGNTLATYWWLEAVQKLAVGVASLINVLSPEVVVIGGGITSGAGDLLMDPLKKFISLYEWRAGDYQVRLVKAKYGSFAGAIGAAHFAKTKHLIEQ